MASTGELDSLPELVRAWYRLTGAQSTDDALIEGGESVDDVCYLSLTRGFRATQAWMIGNGAKERWRKRSAAVSAWSGSDEADGGRYVALEDYCFYEVPVEDEAPTLVPDFLRLDGNQNDRSALVQANGTPWGCEVPADDDWRRGDCFYLKGEQLWLNRTAAAPSPLYIRYYYRYPAVSAATTVFDMPIEARPLCVAEAADAAVKESWVPGGEATESRVARARQSGREEVMRTVLRTREPRRMQGPKRYASRW